MTATPDAERTRLAQPAAWRRWGPYLAERAWGTVREDYSEGGTAWDSFPHDHARSRAYRWNEDGLAGYCDEAQTLCLAFAFWNGHDPILKERIFGLTGPEGNHGEDAKEYWFYLDATPTHSWSRWRYFYPQSAFPYDRLVDENRRRGADEPEFELVDTGALDGDRVWEITVDHAKAGPDDLCVRLVARNLGPDSAVLHVLPTLWFRNTWSWGGDDRRPYLHRENAAIVAEHHALGRYILSGDGAPAVLCCDNETNASRLWGTSGPRFPKDGINDHVVSGLPSVNPDGNGTKAALWYELPVPAGETAEIRLRLRPYEGSEHAADWADTMAAREAEADEFYASLTPTAAADDEARVIRQALAGMLWSKQFFHFDVDRWLRGDPGQPAPPAARLGGRNHEWRHLNNADVLSMPDCWEYPWYAAWDLAFHAVALAHIDPAFAKEQLLLLCREWYMHPNGQLPAYEWAFGDVNPPVHAWAALRVFEIDGSTDFDFLERLMHKLLLNFTWWVNRKDAAGNNVFAGGFLGLDNIGPIDRSAPLPVDGMLEQSDGTAWMAMYCLDLLEMALVLARHDRTYEDIATKFFEHFVYIATAVYEHGLWDDSDGFYYDVLVSGEGHHQPLRVRSMVGLLPLVATAALEPETLAELPNFAQRLRWFLDQRPELSGDVVHRHKDGSGRHDVHAGGHADGEDSGERLLLSIVSPSRLRSVLRWLADEGEFLSPYGVRSLSAAHRDEPFVVDLNGTQFRVGYDPGESTTGLFGGNSNWRGPIWFPVNYLVISALRRFASFFSPSFRVEYPTGSGVERSLGEIADDISARLCAIFLRDPDSGRRPVFGDVELFQRHPAWRDLLPFFEYFHGDNGRGVGASHQTGWTGLVADLLINVRRSAG